MLHALPFSTFDAPSPGTEFDWQSPGRLGQNTRAARRVARYIAGLIQDREEALPAPKVDVLQVANP